MSAVSRINDLRYVAPLCRDKFYRLNQILKEGYNGGATPTWFRPFETFRHPARQADLYDQEPPVTKLNAMLSPHQYGCAVDFVPWDEEKQKWSWADHHDYEYLEVEARALGLRVPIAWDLCHVEHPVWDQVKPLLIR
jgi:hypothetical protein